jgi:hypothetical protein
MASDSFNTTANPLSAPWTAASGFGSLKSPGTEARTAAGADSDSLMYYSGSAQAISEVVVGTNSGADDGGPAIHVDSSGNGYVFSAYDGSGHILKVTAGPNYTDITNSFNAFTFTTGDTIRLRRSGNVLIASKNGSDISTSVSDTTFTGGFDGIFIFDGNLGFDSWTNTAAAASQGRDLTKLGPGKSPTKGRNSPQFQTKPLASSVPNLIGAMAGTDGITFSQQGTLFNPTGQGKNPYTVGPQIGPDYLANFKPRRLAIETSATRQISATDGFSFSSTTASLLGTGALSGNNQLLFGQSGAAVGSGALAANDGLTFGATGSSGSSGLIVGTDGIVFGQTSFLTGTGSLSNAGSGITFGNATSTAIAIGTLSGTAAISLGNGTSALTGTGALAGSDFIVFTSTMFNGSGSAGGNHGKHQLVFNLFP